MPDMAIFHRDDQMASRVIQQRLSLKTNRPVSVMPCALVYIDEESVGSPNSRRPGAFCYIEQAITLNRSLLALGLPRLTIATNVPDVIGRYLADVDEAARPQLLPITPSIALPKNTQFYSAHFKLDLLEQAGRNLSDGTLLLLLDTDMFAHRPLDADLLQRCARTGVGAFDISDQEFSAYGNACVIGDLETVAGRPLANPRWFGGELLVASASFIEALVPRARECFHRYVETMPQLNHQGDEIFMSAALNLLCEQGYQVIDVGAHRLVGRHWSGNTHRDLRWFRRCALLHLPGCKALLERRARRERFSAEQLWHMLVVMHSVNRFVWPLRQWVRARRRARSRNGRLDVLVVECNANRLASLCITLKSHHVGAVYATNGDDALDASRRLCPRVIVVSSPLGVPGAVDILDALLECVDVSRRPIMMARSVDDSRVDWTRWDGWIPRSTDTDEVARLVMGILGK